MSMSFTFFPNLYDRKGQRVEVDTVEEWYAALDTANPPIPGDRKDKDNVRRHTRSHRGRHFVWSPAVYEGDEAASGAVPTWVHALVLDYDGGNVTPERALSAWKDFAAFWQTTRSHTPEHPRFHLIIPFLDPIPGDRWGLTFDSLSADAIPGWDPDAKGASRMWFCPWEGGLRGMQTGKLLRPPMPERPPAPWDRPRHLWHVPSGPLLPKPLKASEREERRRVAYIRGALEGLTERLAHTAKGGRNPAAYRAGLEGGRMVLTGLVTFEEVRQALVGAAMATGLDAHEAGEAVDNGMRRGEQSGDPWRFPVDFSEPHQAGQGTSGGQPPPPVATAPEEPVEAPTGYRCEWLQDRYHSVEEWGWEDPPPEPEYLLTRDGDGILQRGLLGLVGGDGGIGKSYALLELAILTASGAGDRWLGAYDVHNHGPALVVFGEDSSQALHRRLWKLTKGRDLSRGRRPWRKDLEIIAGAGRDLSIVNSGGGRTDFYRDLARIVASREWGLIVLDPLIRFAAGDMETNQEQATRVMQAIQDLVETAPGGPPVLVGVHTSQAANNRANLSQSSIRGCTAIPNAARWIAVMMEDERAHEELGRPVKWQVVKANEDRKGDFVHLVRRGERGGLLEEATKAEIAEWQIVHHRAEGAPPRKLGRWGEGRWAE